MLTLGVQVCFPKLCPSAGRRIAASTARLDYYRTIGSFPPNTLLHPATTCLDPILRSPVLDRNTLQHTATLCNTLQHSALILRGPLLGCNTLQHNAAHCSTLHHSATHRLQIDPPRPFVGTTRANQPVQDLDLMRIVTMIIE